jgi:hypothetical protein
MKLLVSTLTVLTLTAVFPRHAMAYLDPGSGSMVMQLLLAGFAGAAVGLKVFWRKILAFFGFSKNSKSKDAKGNP